MKVITMRQPYAQAVLLGLKRYETRSWATNFRGKIFIHAGKAKLTKKALALAEKYSFVDMHFGEILLVAELSDCIKITPEFMRQQSQTELDFGDWRVGKYAWKLSNVTILPRPIKVKGRLGFWNINVQKNFAVSEG